MAGLTPRNIGWTVQRLHGREVFTAPDGSEFVRATAQTATLTIMFHRPGLSPLYLKPGSRTQIQRLVDRKARRLARRSQRLRRDV